MIEYARLNMEYYRERAAASLDQAREAGVLDDNAPLAADAYCYEYQLSLRSLLIGLGMR